MAHTQEGCQRNIKAQVCDVNKALLSVRRLVETGNRVVFDAQGSYIEDVNTYERMHLTDKQGMYVLRIWTKGAAQTGF